MRYCKKCDKTFPDDSKFCNDCGKKLIKLVEKPVEEPKLPEHREVFIPYKKLILIAVAIGLVILAGSITGLIALPGPIGLTTTTIRTTRPTTIRTTTPGVTTTKTTIEVTTVLQDNVKVSIWSKISNEPISDIDVYLDEEKMCSTNHEGICIFYTDPGGHVLKIRSEGIYEEKAITATEILKTHEFKVERKFDIDIKVVDKLSGDRVSGAEVYVDGSSKGITPSTGILTVSDIIEGEHNIQAKYRDTLSDSKNIRVYPSKTFEIEVLVPRTIMVSVSDEDTEKPIEHVDVYVNEKLMDTTDQAGRARIENILPGTHKFGLDVPTFTHMVEKYYDIGLQDEILIKVDMPNPIYTGSINCNEEWDWNKFEHYGVCDVEITNRGEIDSEYTYAQVLIYKIENNTIKDRIASDTISFGNMAPRDTDSETTERFYQFSMNYDEGAVLVIFDSYPYSTDNEKLLQEITVSESLIKDWVRDGKEWCEADPERCAKVAGIIIGETMKRIASGGAG